MRFSCRPHPRSWHALVELLWMALPARLRFVWRRLSAASRPRRLELVPFPFRHSCLPAYAPRPDHLRSTPYGSSEPALASWSFSGTWPASRSSVNRSARVLMRRAQRPWRLQESPSREDRSSISYPSPQFLLPFLERQYLERRRRLYSINPATIVVNAVAAASVDVHVYASEVGQLVARGVSGRGRENGPVEFTAAAAVSVKRGCAVADDQDHAVPTGITVIDEVACHSQQPISSARNQVEAAVHVNDLRITR